MKPLALALPLIGAAIILSSCKDEFEEPDNRPVAEPIPESTTVITGQAVVKVLPHTGGWVALKETLQPQYYVTQPKREIAWLNPGLSERSNYKPADGWSLLDAVVHPSGHVSAVSIKIVMGTGDYTMHIKMIRFNSSGDIFETEIFQLPNAEPQMPVFPGSLDRVKLVAYGEDVYVVARWRYNEIQAHSLRFEDNQFKVNWKKWVEPPAYVGIIGIIGGGFDNFHQGDRYFFVYADVDGQGNLYVAAPTTEEMIYNHDLYFGENLMAGTDPANYHFGVAVITKFSSNGNRVYSKLASHSRQKRLLNMRVTDEGVFLTGRMKMDLQANGWDAWVYATDLNGNVIYDNTVDIRQGDMFWDINPLPGGGALAVGTTDYIQNPGGLSVSDARKAAAIVLDSQGKKVSEIELPQGPATRGSEAMFVGVLPNGSVIFAGAHNAPGTHAAVYSDGFIAVRDFSPQP
jgi:hypothetical protein